MQDASRLSPEDITANEKRRVAGLRDPYPPAQEPRAPRWRWLLVGILVLSIGLIMVISAGIIGYYDGLKDREETLRIQALEHYRLGVSHLQDANYVLAQAEFEETLRLQPDLKEAWVKLQETQIRMSTIPTPTSAILPTREPTVEPTEEPINLDALLTQARERYRAGNYLEAVAYIEELLKLDPNYQTAQVEEILFNCYYHQALVAISRERLEEAVHLLDLALTLRPADVDAQTERDLAAGYLTAAGYWAADWEQASLQFLRLYQIRPDYKDVASRLYEARYEEAQYLEDLGVWCESADWYSQVLELRADAAVAAKREEMAENCEQNVPPPAAEQATGTPQGTPPANLTETPSEEPTAATSTVALNALGLSGTIYYAIWDNTARAYVIYQMNADGSGSRKVVTGMHQPQINHAGTHLIVRARSGVPTLGLYLVDLAREGASALTMLTSHVDDLYPTFSPDDRQFVFTSNRMSQRLWTLFTKWVEGNDNPQTVIQGQTPAWAPAGDRIAYKGCDPSGNNCGIWLVSQNGAENTRIVTDPSAGFPAWSPDGTQIAFMSNRDGNWDIYLVEADGEGLRRLTRSKSSEGLPTWSPDGKGVAYMSDKDGQWGIYLQRVDSGLSGKLVTLNTVYEDWLRERIAWGPSRVDGE